MEALLVEDLDRSEEIANVDVYILEVNNVSRGGPNLYVRKVWIRRRNTVERFVVYGIENEIFVNVTNVSTLGI